MTTQTKTRFRLGAPQISGPLAVYPILGSTHRFRYRSLRAGIREGVLVSELEGGASVNDVTVINVTTLPVLLYEGELITGAQQNRMIDQPVLVPAAAKIMVPVSCVEQGRWDYSQSEKPFQVSPHMSDPGLRSIKRATSNQNYAAGLDALPDQGEVWDHVASQMAAHDVDAVGDDFTELFEAKDTWLTDIRASLYPAEDQVGAVVQINGRPVAFDLVSRPEAFADLFPGLLDGYALQALPVIDGAAAEKTEPDDAAALDFFDLVLKSRRRWAPTRGMGDAFVPTRRRITGCGLRAEGELVALSAFPSKVGG